MRYHLMNIAPTAAAAGPMHGLLGHAEVIETVRWGLAALGHEVTVGNNSFRAAARNVVFGAQVLDVPMLASLPGDTVVYNLEQLARLSAAEVRPSVRFVAEHFEVWDYDRLNLPAWQAVGARSAPKVVPIGWAPTLRRIPRREQEDVDVLLYGMPGAARMDVVRRVCGTGLGCVFACGLYGASRDDLIGRAKLVLNVNLYDRSRVFEIVRVSYLLANGKAVVSDVFPDSVINDDLRDAVAFTPQERIAQTCVRLVNDGPARAALADRGRAAFERRDIRDILRRAVGE